MSQNVDVAIKFIENASLEEVEYFFNWLGGPADSPVPMIDERDFKTFVLGCAKSERVCEKIRATAKEKKVLD